MTIELWQDAVRLTTGIVAYWETISTGGCMGHDWILSVLKDLSSYARSNGLPGLANKADEALRVAEAEISDGARTVHPDGLGTTAIKPH